MENEQIALEEFCSFYDVEISFIQKLNESGLISVHSVKKTSYLSIDEMPKVEKFIRLHYDLEINLPGLETIDHLLQKVEVMQEELRKLKSRVEGV